MDWACLLAGLTLVFAWFVFFSHRSMIRKHPEAQIKPGNAIPPSPKP